MTLVQLEQNNSKISDYKIRPQVLANWVML